MQTRLETSEQILSKRVVEDFKVYLETGKDRITKYLHNLFDTMQTDYSFESLATEKQLHQAMRYSVCNGGKRLRPILVYATGEALGVDIEKLDAAAAAVELIHCYSLIHDDLPAMDDDDMRRGKPSCHKVFGEAMAILAGDALQALAFEVLSSGGDHDLPTVTRIEMISTLAKNIGSKGMAGGQALDILMQAGDHHCMNNDALNLLAKLHQKKTGALLETSVKFAVIIANNDDIKLVNSLENYARHIGLSFQVQDDILDVIGSSLSMGKAARKDQALNKMTFPGIMGLDAAKQYAKELHEKAVESLQGDFEKLARLSQYFIERID